MIISNINGTVDSNCFCGSWLDHWKKFSGQSARLCPVENCRETELVGAQVQKGDGHDRSWYIIPLCRKHNGETGESLTVSDYATLVSANVCATCGMNKG